MPAELGMPRLDDVLQRTTDGVEALFASVKLAASQPERAAFLVAHDVAVVSRVFGWERAVRVAEPLMLPMLAGSALRSERTGPKKFGLSVALATGTALQQSKSETPEKASWPAALAAATQYLAYGFSVRGTFAAKQRPAGTLARLGLVTAGWGLALGKNRDVALATLVGGAPLAWASELANDAKVRRDGTTPAQGVSHGANLLMAGEALTLVRATLLKGRRGWGTRLVEAAAVSANAVGSMLLVDGVSWGVRRR